MNENFKDKLSKNKSILVLLVFSIIITLINPRFLTFSNIFNVLRQTSINAVIAAGMTFVILSGGIDLSVGSILAISGAVAAFLVSKGVSVFAVVVIALAIGMIIGALKVLKGEKVEAYVPVDLKLVTK